MTPTPPFFVLTFEAVVDEVGESFSIPFPVLFLKSAGEDILLRRNFAVQFSVLVGLFGYGVDIPLYVV